MVEPGAWAVAGASGRTGRAVVAHLMAAGHDVVAFARSASTVFEPGPSLRVVNADIRDATAVRAAIQGCVQVVSAVGAGASRGRVEVYSIGVANLLDGLEPDGSLAVVSAAPVGDRSDFGWVDHHVVMPVLDQFFGSSYADMRRMEAILERSSRPWVCLRPPRLVERAATGSWRIGRDRPPRRSRSISYADLAAALVASLDQPGARRYTAYVSN